MGYDREVGGVVSHRAAGGLDGVVLGGVVDENDLVGPAALTEHLHRVLEDATDVLSLVVGRDGETDVHHAERHGRYATVSAGAATRALPVVERVCPVTQSTSETPMCARSTRSRCCSTVWITESISVLRS